MTTSPIPIAPRSVRVPTDRRPFPWLGLIILSLGVFLSISSEVTPTGLMPEMSGELGVSEAQIGLLVSFFAFTVVITSAPLTAFTRRVPRKPLLIGVLVVLGLANLATGLAPTYPLIIVARVVGGLAHGLFWSMVPAYSAQLVSREQLGRAVSVTLAGGTLALVLGVPLATALGHAVGWRWAFVAIAVALSLGALAVALWLPAVRKDRIEHADAATGARRDPTVLPVVIVCITVAIVMIGNYAFYTYIAPYLIGPLSVPGDLVSVVLFVYGGAGAIGLVLTGTLFARRTRLGLVIGLAVTAAAVALLAVSAAVPVLSFTALVLWGLAFGMVPPLLQTRMLQTASDRFRDTASAFYTTAFNAGISGGAFVGALLLPRFGLEALPVANVVLTLAGLVILLTVIARGRRHRAM
ncbi:Predicted arabinose efflux permease, MFS family [Paramicrobacterium humi]|uniref:Predicted arabinose efflux permease, MFS family n=1 Tax=Paramicrobacterium humi TaxID=640635 RepID=A0A1H4IXX2_9MICO|nr:MFS transporter [Microbacterium humi]SEB38188.1 Predicted arabinose efflux permease, MFS family [Microbacterium humi]